MRASSQARLGTCPAGPSPSPGPADGAKVCIVSQRDSCDRRYDLNPRWLAAPRRRIVAGSGHVGFRPAEGFLVAHYHRVSYNSTRPEFSRPAWLPGSGRRQ